MFTAEPANPFPAVEGGNITLEWSYTFCQDGSFRQVVFGNTKIPTIADQWAGDRDSWIEDSYKNRSEIKITDNFTLITLHEVRRTDSGTYSLTIISNQDRDKATSTVEISVQCEYEKETNNYTSICFMNEARHSVLCFSRQTCMCVG